MDSKHVLAGKFSALIPVLLLLAAVFGHWPYGFYTLLRLVVCGSSIYLVVKANSARTSAWSWIFGGMAVVFNPILPLHFHRRDWRLVDLIAFAILLVFVARYKSSTLSKV